MFSWIAQWFRSRRIRRLETEILQYEDALPFWRQELDRMPDVIIALNLGYCRAKRDELQAEIDRLKGFAP